jgi:hypothetical protein
MGLRDKLLHIALPARLRYDAARNALFVNFERLVVRSEATVLEVERAVSRWYDNRDGATKRFPVGSASSNPSLASGADGLRFRCS